jgi:hypothetical protein
LRVARRLGRENSIRICLNHNLQSDFENAVKAQQHAAIPVDRFAQKFRKR